jgi:hypothetical protein
MSTLIVNAVTFSGLPNGTGNQSAWQPDSYVASEVKIGVTLPAADGTRNRVERSVVKRTWEVGWQACNLATMQTVRTIQRLTTTFTFTDLEGVSYTVQTEDDAFAPEWAFNDPSGASFWTVKLVLYQK